MTNGRNAREELSRIGDAIDESILNASTDELRDDLASQGLDADKIIEEMDALTRDAKLASGKRRLEVAQEAVRSFKAQGAGARPADRAGLRAKLYRMRSAGEGDGLMMAARKGKQLSERDEEGTLDDLAQLEALEAHDDEASEE